MVGALHTRQQHQVKWVVPGEWRTLECVHLLELDTLRGDTHCHVTHCDVTHCDVTRCDVTHCNVIHCDVTHCDMTHCDVTHSLPRTHLSMVLVGRFSSTHFRSSS